MSSLEAIHEAVEQARFEQAEGLAHDFLARAKLPARERNDALELLAIVQIAQRNGAGARETLKLLFDRDPEHPRRVHDPGPAIDAAFARARKATHQASSVVLAGQSRHDAYGRDWLDVSVSAGADIVDRVHIFVRAERDPEFTEIVRPPDVDDRVTALLPASPLGAKAYYWYVEARAPSGLLLARIASAELPNESARVTPVPSVVTRCPPPKQPEPLVHRWWLWTSISVVVAGAAIAGAVAAQ